MRLYLDEDVSYHVAEQLRGRGYDVSSAFETNRLELPDEDQLTYATGERRVLVTYNVGDFSELVREWFNAGRSHYGVILIKDETIARKNIGGLVRALAALMNAHPAEDAFRDRCDYLAPAP
jgi:predicted nuclease of predicted toxin-antitoxin system